MLTFVHTRKRCMSNNTRSRYYTCLVSVVHQLSDNLLVELEKDGRIPYRLTFILERIHDLLRKAHNLLLDSMRFFTELLDMEDRDSPQEFKSKCIRSCYTFQCLEQIMLHVLNATENAYELCVLEQSRYYCVVSWSAGAGSFAVCVDFV